MIKAIVPLLAVVAALPAAAADSKSSGLAAAYLSAQYAESLSDAAKASDYLDRALKLDASNPDLLRLSYMLHAQAGDIPAAVNAARQYVAAGSGPMSTAQILVAVGQHKKGEHDAAWETIGKVSGQGFIAAALPIMRAWFRAPGATVDEALAELAPMQSRENAQDSYELMSAMINEFFGRGREAMDLYASVGGRIERLPPSFVRLLAGGYHRHSKTAELQLLLEAYRKARPNSRDVALYAEAFADPKQFAKKVSADAGLAEAMFLTSQAMLANSSNSIFLQLAMIYGQSALYLDPGHSLARWIIGEAAARGEAFEASNAILGTIKPGDPVHAVAQLQIAENLERLGRSGDALAQLQMLARARSDDPDAQMALGDLLRRESKFREAADAYDKAFALYPGGSPENWALFYIRGIALERAKDWTRAEADFKRALELNPDEPSVLNYLGYSWLDRNENLAEARRLIEAAYKKRPDDGAIIDSLGWAMYLAGEYQDAVTYLEKAVEQEPSDSAINGHLGDAYWKVGRRNEARFQWRRAISLSTDDAEKTALRAKLDQGLAQN
ncbi:MAG: tetratricopeptide repeat protein [Alphaproteobacteria bacterium]|nr:tetratricopeptide repeat protein [Alphaproteobacteria bacterium]